MTSTATAIGQASILVAFPVGAAIVGSAVAVIKPPRPAAEADRPVTARFVSSCLLRTVTARSYMQQISEGLGPLVLLHKVLAQESADVDDIHPATMDSLLRRAQDLWPDVRPRVDSREAMLRVTLRKYDEFAARLASWTWTTHTADRNVLLTSDAPVATLRPMTGWGGILPQGSPVFMPISPRVLLVGQELPQLAVTSERRSLDKELSSLSNAAIAAEAYEAVFRHPEMPWPSRLALGADSPQLSRPTVTWSKSSSSDVPGRGTYPPVSDRMVATLISCLEDEAGRV